MLRSEEILSWERSRKNDAKWYSQVSETVSEFNSVRSISGDRFLKHAFASWRRQLSSRASSRNEFRYLGSRAQREKGVGKAGLCLWGHSEEKGWLVMVLTRFCGCRGGVFDLSPFLLPSSPSMYIYIYVYHFSSHFLFPSSTRFPPYKYTLRLIPSIFFLLSTTISSLPTNQSSSFSLFSFSIYHPKLPPPRSHLFLSCSFFIHV